MIEHEETRMVSLDHEEIELVKKLSIRESGVSEKAYTKAVNGLLVQRAVYSKLMTQVNR